MSTKLRITTLELKTELWLADSNLLEQISRFVDAVVPNEKMNELIMRLAARHLELFMDSGRNKEHVYTHLGQ